MYKMIKNVKSMILILYVMGLSHVYALSDVINEDKRDLSTNVYILLNTILIVIPPIVVGLIIYYILKKSKLPVIAKRIISAIILVIFLSIYIYGCIFLLSYNEIFSGVYY